jgi:hypothetical protein
MHITIQQDQQPSPTLIDTMHPRSAKFLAFAQPGKICLIFIVNDIKPLPLIILEDCKEQNRLLSSLLSDEAI